MPNFYRDSNLVFTDSLSDLLEMAREARWIAQHAAFEPVDAPVCWFCRDTLVNGNCLNELCEVLPVTNTLTTLNTINGVFNNAGSWTNGFNTTPIWNTIH